jgi:hypothetical protein
LNRLLSGRGLGGGEVLSGRGLGDGDGLLVGDGDGLLLGDGDGVLDEDGVLDGDGLLVGDGVPPPVVTGVSSLSGLSYGYTSQATPSSSASRVLGSLGSRLNSACASA